MMVIKNILLLSLAVTVSGKIVSFLTLFESVCASIGFTKTILIYVPLLNSSGTAHNEGRLETSAHQADGDEVSFYRRSGP